MMPLTRFGDVVKRARGPVVQGRLSEAVGLILEARGCSASLGDLYEVVSDGERVEAEVVGLRGARTLLMPLGPTHGLEAGAPLRRLGRGARAGVGDAMLGRVLDALGRPLDGDAPPPIDDERTLDGGETPNPLARRPVETPFPVGVRAIDGLLTMGVGQRIGIFAGAGVGKSSLLGMMVRGAEADVAVVALIGERGREVEEFVHRTLGEEGMRRSVVVAATSAESPLVRARGALFATAIAEHFRDRGKRVLLVMDSVTRYAMALREIGLAVGEPPTTKGYTPSVFAALPRLLERAGTSEGRGSITGVYTVLVEGDDLSDPISDAARGILDGHVVLSRELAERGHFPAIAANASVSRVMSHVANPEQQRFAQRARKLIAAHREARDLQSIGAYKPGTVARLDEALARFGGLEAFLQQGLHEHVTPQATRAQLEAIWTGA